MTTLIGKHIVHLKIGFTPFLAATIMVPAFINRTFAQADLPQREPSKPPPSSVDDLARRLIEGKNVEHDSMANILDDMEDAERRLRNVFDTGTETQAIQRQILKKLDDAIASAVRRGSGRPSGDKVTTDVRRKPGTMNGQSDGGQPGESGDAQPTDGTASRGEGETTDVGIFGGTEQSWGFLPPRDRDEVIQGIQEQSLPKFREWIEDYYRALAEQDQP